MNVTILVTVLPFIKISLTYASNFVWKHTKAYAACGSSSGSTLSQYGGGTQRTGLESIPDARSAFRPPSDKRPARHKTIISVKYTIMTKPEQR